MKNKLILIALSLFSANCFGQPTFSATVTKTSGEGNVTVSIRTSATKTGKISGLTATLAIPTSAGSRPVVVVDNSPNTNIIYTFQDGGTQNVNGTPHYIYNLLGEGNVVLPPAATYTAGVDYPIVKATFTGSDGAAALVKMVNLPDGGTTSNSFFGLSIDGVDVVNEASMFYSIPSFSTAQNNIIPGGYSGLSLSETTQQVPIPVKFIGFTAIKKDNDAVLSWSVENESSITDRYEVERSLNGTDFAKVATVAPKNNGNTSNFYTATDKNLSSIRSSGAIYYRVKQIDKDGKYVYTEIRSVRLDKGISIGVYPNPVKDAANVTLDLVEATDVFITVTDAAGKEIQKVLVKGQKGLNVRKINMANMAAGTYMFRVTADTEVKTISVVKAQ